MALSIRNITSVNLTRPTAMGWCLKDVREAFGFVGNQYAKYRNARAAYAASKTKHSMSELPKQNVFVPVWIKYGAVSVNDHVMVHNPATGLFYSDDNTTGHFIAYASYQAWANRVTAYKPTLLGWTEDVEDRRVLEVSQNSSPTPVPAAPVSGELPTRGYWTSGDNSDTIGRITSFMRKNFPAYTPASALGPIYGPNAIGAIKEFQRRTGLAPDGNIGPITMAKLKEFGFRG